MAKIKAVGLLSGGLDSTLATKIIQDMGIDVVALNFNTGFCIINHHQRLKRSSEAHKVYRNEALRTGSELLVKVEIIDVADEFLSVVTHPKHGYGSAINPCIDCRILMLQKAKQYLMEHGAHFIFTGEVLGQRPMSQYRKALALIAKESGLDGLLLRPLSARLLDPTIPEKKGWVDRNRLLAIEGRGRKTQMQLAAKVGIADYPQPSGGCCFLVDKNYARRLRDLFECRGRDNITREDMFLLKLGRHYRINPNTKCIVGRDEAENKLLADFTNGRAWCQVKEYVGPLTLMEGNPTRGDCEVIAGITAVHSDAEDCSDLAVECMLDGKMEILNVGIPKREDLSKWRI